MPGPSNPPLGRGSNPPRHTGDWDLPERDVNGSATAPSELTYPAPDLLPKWPHPWDNRYAGLRPSMGSQVERLISVTGCIWGNTIGQNYGQNTITGHVAFSRVLTTDIIYYGIVFCHGAQSDIHDVTFSDEADPAYLTFAPVYHKGDGSALSSVLTGSTGWTAAQTDLWERLAHVIVRIDKSDPSFASFPTIKAICDGCLFKSFGIHTAAGAYINAMDVLYNMHQDSVVWKGDVTARLGVAAGGTWEEWQAYCEEVTGDGTKRGSVQGVIYDRDPEAAIQRVAGHVFSEIVADEQSVLQIWGEKPPPAITGTFAAAATVTITGTSSTCLTSVAADEYGYFDKYWAAYGVRQIDSVTNDLQFILKGTAVTIAAGTKWRRLHHGGIYLEKSDWHKLPVKCDVSAAELADVVRVKYSLPTGDLGDYYEDGVYSIGTEDIRVEKTMSLLKTASAALRHAETAVDLEHGNYFRWEKGIAGAKAAALEVGDVFLFFDGRHTQCGRLHPPRAIAYENGLYELPRIVRFDGSVFSEETKINPVPGGGGDWTTVPPVNLPTNVNQQFLYFGDWERYNILADEDDLTATGSNFTATNVVLTLDGSGDFTTISIPGVAGFAYSPSIGSADFPGGVAPNMVLISVMYRQSGTYQADGTLAISYGTGLHSATTRWVVSLPFDDAADTDWKQLPIISDSDDGHDTFEIYFSAYGGAANTMTFDVRKVYIMAWGGQPNLSMEQRYTWTEHASAADTIVSYEIWQRLANGINVPTRWVVPQGNSSLLFTILAGAGVHESLSRVGGEYYLRARGRKTTYADIPVNTQSFQKLLPLGDLGSVRDVDETNIAAGTSIVVDTDGVTKVNSYLTTSIPLTTYVDKIARFAEQEHHGGILALVKAQPLDSTPTDLVFTTGVGKFFLCINAGTDLTGTITVTGTSVNRNTGAETASDTETITVDALTTDTSSADAQGNVIHGFAGAYISSKWWHGAVTLSTANLTLTDVDVYHISFEQVNDQADITLQTFDINAFPTNAAAWFYAYLYSVIVAAGKVTINNEASLPLPAASVTASRYYRLRRGALGVALDGATDGLFFDAYFGPTNQTYWEDVTFKVWVDARIRIEA